MIISYLLALLLFLSTSYAENCGINLYGSSYVGLSADSANTVFSNEDYMQHTFEVWANPSRFVSQEQNILQTGVIGATLGGTSWAVEFKLKVTIWQQGHTKPSSSVLYIDVWTSEAAEHSAPVWSKTRFYVILGEENYPWVHVTFTTPSDLGSGNGANLLINGKRRRMDKYSPVVLSDAQPRINFAIGDQFYGAIDEVRIWKALPTADIFSSLCSDDIDANTVLYIPFSECSGDILVGYKQNNTVCAMMYGAYGDVSARSSIDATNSQSNPIWTNGAPISFRSCTLAYDGQCVTASRVDAVARVDSIEKVDAPWGLGPTDPKLISLPLALLLLALLVRSTLKNNNQPQLQQQPQALAEC